MLQRGILALGLALTTAAHAQWDSIVGQEPLTLGETHERWFAVRNGNTAFLVDGDTGRLGGTIPLSRFSPALAPHMSEGRIYSYGSFFTRDVYGDRTDLLLVFDLQTLSPVGEIELPPITAGIGHPGMMGLIDDRFVGVWNITPGMSVSIADVRNQTFVREISTPGCAAVYPVGRGFLMPCGDGTVQYIALSDQGEEIERLRSEKFFDVTDDFIYDYAVPAENGWMFVSVEGQVYTVEVGNGNVLVSQPWSINPETDGVALANDYVPPKDDSWRIGGRQPFAYNAQANLLVTVMHAEGGQDTFEDAGTEVWGFDTRTQKRGYRLKLPDGIDTRSVQLTQDEEPLLLVSTDEGIRIYEGRTGHELRVVESVRGGTIQNLYEAPR
ncbi:amine dehydrogenase large subunit [Gilvimarinus sp. F26214L]|uniref:amine dehydrogenase large subunit n=1 Tax=Gilvimarinus sp. DZF01 TaxID=3461371 RepID=UPI004045FDCF